MPGRWRLACGITKVLFKDYPRWAEPMGDEIRAQAERLAEEAGLSIEFIRTYKSFRKGNRAF